MKKELLTPPAYGTLRDNLVVTANLQVPSPVALQCVDPIRSVTLRGYIELLTPAADACVKADAPIAAYLQESPYVALLRVDPVPIADLRREVKLFTPSINVSLGCYPVVGTYLQVAVDRGQRLYSREAVGPVTLPGSEPLLTKSTYEGLGGYQAISAELQVASAGSLPSEDSD